MTFLIGNYPSLENLKRNDMESELFLESIGKFVRIGELVIFATWSHGHKILAENVFVARIIVFSVIGTRINSIFYFSINPNVP